MSTRSRAWPWFKRTVHLRLDTVGFVHGSGELELISVRFHACGAAVDELGAYDYRHTSCDVCRMSVEVLLLASLVEVKWSLGEVRVVVAREAFPYATVPPPWGRLAQVESHQFTEW